MDDKIISANIRYLIDKQYGCTLNAFAKKVDIDPSNLRRKMAGLSKFNSANVIQICRCLGVNREWLTENKGEPFVSVEFIPTLEGRLKAKGTEKEITIQEVPMNTDTEDACAHPFFDIDFALGFDEMYNDTPNVPTKKISVPGYEKVDFWCRASGDSMKPAICGGDIIALREIHDWDLFLPLNEIYAVMTTNGLRTVKMVRSGSDDDHLILHAQNEEYGDQEISKHAIMKIFKVIGTLRTI